MENILGSEENRKYWLHRISHCSGASYAFLEKNYVTIGFSDFLDSDEFLTRMQGDNEGKWDYFENENIRLWNKKYRSRYSLWRFLCGFKEGDFLIIPKSKQFSVYRVCGKAIAIGTARQAIAGELKGQNGSNIVSFGCNDQYIKYEGEENTIDLGFAYKVEAVQEDIDRTLYAPNDLVSRLKIYSTNAEITDLKKDIEEAIDRKKNNKPINVFHDVHEKLASAWKEYIDKYIKDDQFEKLIATYFKAIGANDVKVISKRAGKEYADGDVLARFDKLNLTIFVQAKHYKGETSSWAVEQIKAFREQKAKDELDEGYICVPWVITASEEYSPEAQKCAIDYEVRLINGPEFIDMLIDAGLSEVKRDFAVDEIEVEEV